MISIKRQEEETPKIRSGQLNRKLNAILIRAASSAEVGRFGRPKVHVERGAQAVLRAHGLLRKLSNVRQIGRSVKASKELRATEFVEE